MKTEIINNRVDGTRITVWDVYHYLEGGDWTLEQIADVLPLTIEQLRDTAAYIEEHKEEVLAGHREIEERNARGNPPEIREKLKASRAKLEALKAEIMKKKSRELARVRNTG